MFSYDSIIKLYKIAVKIKDKKLLSIVKEAMVSMHEKVKSQINGFLTTAYQKYFQIRMMPGYNETHWFNPLKAALRDIIRCNTADKTSKGFYYKTKEIESIAAQARIDGFNKAFDHLQPHLNSMGMSFKQAKQNYYREVSLQELFSFAEIELPIWKDKYEK